MSKPKVGIQLYSVRDFCQKDFLGTIRQIADIGYKYVEFAGYYGVSAKDLRAVLAETGIKAPSAHVGLGLNQPTPWQELLKQQLEYALELGLTRFIVPHYPLGDNPTLADVEKWADILEEASDIVTPSGLTFGYHNHAFEFQPVEGKLAIDRLLERVPASKLFAEFDLGWVKVGGQDPAAYVEKYASRLPVVHAKDFHADGTDAEIGKGSVDWDSALAAVEKAGVEFVIIEQEGYKIDSLTSAKNNLNFFRERGWV